MDRPITRRDFLDGVAVGVGAFAAGGFSTLAGSHTVGGTQAAQAGSASTVYPPALTGLRGSAVGSFEVAHALRDGTLAGLAGAKPAVDEHYDLVIVGAGISGLAAAYFHRKLASAASRVLILDNHDDFGGHARRDEFSPRGRLLLTNGGTWSIESPFAYSREAAGLFEELGIDPPRLHREHARPDARKNLGNACFFDRETFGTDRLVVGEPDEEADPTEEGARAWQAFLARTPLSTAARESIQRIQCAQIDYLAGLTQTEKKARLSRTSYRDFLLRIAQAHPDAIPFYQTRTHDLYGLGIDAVPALDCWATGAPGFQGLGLDRVPSAGLSFTALGAVTEKDEYFFHFPDGNASIARMLVRSLVPACAAGRTAEDVVTARFDYSKLDVGGAPIRIRLNSTVVSARNVSPDGGGVELAYMKDGALHGVRAKTAVLACWNCVIPYLCPELPEKQKEALRYGVKVPLVYTAVAVRNTRAFHRLGLQRAECPGMYHSWLSLDLVVNMGGYAPALDPDEPAVVRMIRTPCHPGLSARDQQRAGRVDLLATSFETFERNIRDQLLRVLGAGGFDPARDIDAITVNRWPHGYAYEYNPLWDPDWPPGQRPCEIARQTFGRIAIANADAAAAAYTDQAIDQAYRAIRELAAQA